MEGIVEQKARTTEERLVDTFLPFVLWRPIKMLSFIGYHLSREQASAFTRFLLPPPTRLVRVIELEARDFLSPALHSSTWSRKVRRAMQWAFQEKLKRDIEKKHPVLLAARGFFAFLETSPSDRDKMVEVLNTYKVRELEERQERLLTTLVESPQAIESLFPPEKVLDPRLYKRIVIDLGPEELRAGIIALLADYYRALRLPLGNLPCGRCSKSQRAKCKRYDLYSQCRKGAEVVSLNSQIEDGEGNSIELIDTIADDSAVDLDAWLDARVWLLGCPRRLVQIAHKRVSGIPLEAKDQEYLRRFRKNAQLKLF